MTAPSQAASTGVRGSEMVTALRIRLPPAVRRAAVPAGCSRRHPGRLVRGAIALSHAFTDTFGTCQCVGFPTDERDTHVLA